MYLIRKIRWYVSCEGTATV